MSKYIGSKAAAALLGVTAATLYAYVSRGLIRSEETSGSQRERRYLREDVIKLVERKQQRRDPSKAAQAAMHWGVPVLDSALTLITDSRLFYRGQDACDLARTASFEEVAALLWDADPHMVSSLFVSSTGNQDRLAGWSQPSTMGGFLAALQRALAHGGEHDLQASTHSPTAMIQGGVRIVAALTTAICGQPATGSIVGRLAAAWGLSADHQRLLNAALILTADHELNASSFAARIVASTEANLYAVVAGGLAALSGAKHGGHTARVAAMMREVEATHDTRAALRDRLQRGDGIPGFGHRLYPAGDPRASCLLELLKETYGAELLRPYHDLLAEVSAAIGEAPTIDFAFVVLERLAHLPNGAAFALFALGRSAGWIAHALEQYATASLIRPRARYVGKIPSL